MSTLIEIARWTDGTGSLDGGIQPYLFGSNLFVVFNGGATRTLKKIRASDMAELGSYTDASLIGYIADDGTNLYIDRSGAPARSITKFDPVTMLPISSCVIGGVIACAGLFYDSGFLYFTEHNSGNIYKIDVTTMTVTATWVGGSVQLRTALVGTFLFAEMANGHIYRINTATMATTHNYNYGGNVIYYGTCSDATYLYVCIVPAPYNVPFLIKKLALS